MKPLVLHSVLFSLSLSFYLKDVSGDEVIKGIYILGGKTEIIQTLTLQEY
jgi:hypothetical protein